MAELKISFIEGNSYRIEGAIEELLTNKRAKMMLRSQLAYREEGGALIVENEDGIEQVASILKLVAGYIGATIVYDDKTSSDIADFKSQEEDYKEQSQTERRKFSHILPPPPFVVVIRPAPHTIVVRIIFRCGIPSSHVVVIEIVFEHKLIVLN